MTDIAVHPKRSDQPAAGKGGSPDCAAFSRVVGADCTQRSWWLGGAGRDQVATRLARLGDRWKVLHGVPVPGAGTADEIVIGPAGVFTVTTCQEPGSTVWVGGDTVLVNGAPTSWVPSARQLARHAAAALSQAGGRPLSVTGLVVVVGAHDGFVDHAQPADGVRVLTRRDVDGWLSARPQVWGDDVVDLMFAAARLPQTWGG